MKHLVTPNKHSEEIKNRYRTDTDTATDELNAHLKLSQVRQTIGTTEFTHPWHAHWLERLVLKQE